MVVSTKPQALPGTSLKSLVSGYLLPHQTEGSSPSMIEYYQGILGRFLWYAERQGWPQDARLVNEWHIREFLGYVITSAKRWCREGNGSESSSSKVSSRTVYHYYGALRAFFNWAVREALLAESPLAKIKVAKPKATVIRPYSLGKIRQLLAVCLYNYAHNARFLGSRNETIILMLLDSGLRVSELANIDLQDIDRERGWIRVTGKRAREMESTRCNMQDNTRGRNLD